MDSADFARWFRDATPYIRAHRGRTFVVLLDAEVLDCPNLGDLVRDLALLHALGVNSSSSTMRIARMTPGSWMRGRGMP